MRKFFLLFVFFLVAGSLLAWLMQRESGYVLIAVGQTSIEMNLWALVVLLLLFWALWRLVKRLLSSLKWFGRWRLFSTKRSRKKTADGLLAYMEGRWAVARRKLLSGAGHSEMPLVNYLGAANAAFETGDEELAEELLLKAETMGSGNQLAINVSRIRFLIRGGNCEEALAVLARTQREYPRYPHLLKLYEQAYRGLGDWENILELLPDLRRHKVYSKSELLDLEIDIFVNVLDALRQRISHEQGHEARDKLLSLWSGLPGQVRKSSQAILNYGRALAAVGDVEQAEKLLAKSLNREWDDKLVELYGNLPADLSRQMVVAEAWHRERPNNASLLLALGRLSIRGELWGKARDYLNMALKSGGGSGVYLELGRVMAQLGDTGRSTQYYQKGLEAMASDS